MDHTTEDVEQLCELVERVVRESAPGAAVETITPDTPLLLSGLLDSLTIMKIVAEVERCFGVPLAESEIVAANFRSPAALWRAIRNARDARERTGAAPAGDTREVGARR